MCQMARCSPLHTLKGYTMSKKYEREIEEILRNMDEGESRGRINPLRRARARGAQGIQVSLATLSVVLLVISILLMVVAAGITFYEQKTSTLSGAIAVAAFIVFLLAAASGWRNYFRGSSLTAPSTRYGASPFDARPHSIRDSYTVPPSFVRPPDDDLDDRMPTPLRRGPIDAIRTRIRLLRLRQRYRRAHED
jgi:hypothetical protein